MRNALIILALLSAFLILKPASFHTPAASLQSQEGGAGTEAAAQGTLRQEEAGGGAADSHGAEEGHGGGHENPVTPVLLAIVIVLLAAKLGGALVQRLGQPAVLGELIFGILMGNLTLLGWDGLEFISHNQGMEVLAELGVILLLFEVGLESNVTEMLSVGPSSLVVALLGVIAPFFIGWGLSAWLLPGQENLVHLFIAATLCATSVGITARVLSDLGKIKARESKIILGAAVIDDVLGLVILAVVSGVIQAANVGGQLETLSILWIIGKAALFLVGAILIGGWLSPRLFRLANRLQMQGMLLVVSLSFCFLLAYIAKALDLEPIVGAFAAGLVLDEVHYRSVLHKEDRRLEDLLRPLTTVLVPVFFVLIGMKVDLSTFSHVEVLSFAALLSLGAIVGKMICAFGVLERGLDRISVAVGMVPRGEVGLIFASIGAGLILHGERVINDSIFSAVVIMVMITTLMTPPALKVTLARGDRRKARTA